MRSLDDLQRGLASLRRTPPTLDAWLRGLDAAQARQNEGPDTWSPFDVVGHLIHCEQTDWIPRARIVREHGPDVPFEPFDRFAQMAQPKAATLDAELDLFAELRAANLAELEGYGLGDADLERAGTHPELGPVTLGQLLSAWVAHDLVHIRQIARVLTGGYRDDVGPWAPYLSL